MTAQTTKTEDVGTLIARLREATGADRALDAAIFELVTGQSAYMDTPSYGGGAPIRKRLSSLPNYTASVDCALSLVPEGAAVWVGYDSIHPGKAVVHPPMPPTSMPIYAATPALALCIGALLAMESALEARRQAP